MTMSQNHNQIVNVDKYPKFASYRWKDFENFCCDIFRVLWKNPYAQLNGRLRQSQHGIDVFGNDKQSNFEKPPFVGAQCKIRSDKKGFFKSVLKDIEKAEGFKPDIQIMVVATTLETDSTIQEAINIKNEERIKAGKFPVHITFWEDLVHAATPEIRYKYFKSPDCTFPFEDFNEFIDFRSKEHLDRTDFENDLYYKNEKIHEAIDKIISTRNKCLLIGKPDRGKTSMALGYAYYFLKEKNLDERERQVFYLDVETDKDFLQWLNQMKLYDYSHCLFIIDNCHMAVDEVNELVGRWGRIKDAKILLVSRDIQPDLAGLSTENYLELMEEENQVVLIETEETVIKGIVSKYRAFSNKKQEEVGEIKEILEKCGGNLYLLYLFIEAWGETEKRFLSEIEEKTVLNDVYRIYLKNRDKETRLAFLKIAALYQFEITVQKQYVGEMQEDKKGLLNKLIKKKEGEIPTAFFSYHHSTIAEYLLKAAFEKGDLGLKVEDYTFKILMDYICFKPVNFFNIFIALYSNEKMRIQSKIFKQEDTFQVYEEIVSGYNDKELFESLRFLARFLMALWKNDDEVVREKSVEYAGQLKHQLDKRNIKKQFDMYDIRTLISLLSLSKINKQFNDYLSYLDYGKLGNAAQKEHLRHISYFLSLIKGIPGVKIVEFIEALDVRALGEKSKDVGLATIRNFIQFIYQSGVDKQLNKQTIRDFCDALNFKELGERSKDVGLATIKAFIQKIYQSGIGKKPIRDFCDGLNFRRLGNKSKDVGHKTITGFISTTYQSDVEKELIQRFCRGIGYGHLGKKFISHILEGKEVIFDLNMILNFFNKRTSIKFAREFIRGIGWDTLKKAVEERLSPDELMLIGRLLFEYCEFNANDLQKKYGIFITSKISLFRAFTRHKRSHYTEEKARKPQNYYMKCALKLLIRDTMLNSKIRSINDLEVWSNFIFNLRYAKPDFIRENISPVLQRYSSGKFNYLFSKADLENIGYFLSYFNPLEEKDQIFTWSLPKTIRFTIIDFPKRLKESSLVNSAQFVFNFYYINRMDCSNRFAHEIDKNHSFIISNSLLEEVSIGNIEFFLWNLWMALPEGCVPSILDEPEFLEVIVSKLINRTEKKEDVLSLIGNYYLSTGSVPEALCQAINPRNIKDVWQHLKEEKHRGIRILAGYYYLTKEKIIKGYFIRRLSFIHKSKLNIPNQMQALNTFIRAFVEDSLVPQLS